MPILKKDLEITRSGGYRLDGISIALLEKLNKIEEFENELGLDIITVLKALKYPIYVKEVDQTYWASNRLYFGFGDPFIVISGARKADIILSLCDYGKTWALTKEEIK